MASRPRKRSRPRPHDRHRAHAFMAAHPEAVQGSTGDAAGGVRLNRWLAERGIASRRKADEIIQEGRVEVNGEFQTAPGYRVRPGDEVRVDGAPVREVARLYYVFHKPKGVLCTDSPREKRLRVRDLVEPLVPSRVFTVGRLDEDSEGLLLLTNDGDFAQLVSHPRYGVPKTYLVTVPGELARADLERLRKGVYLAEGRIVPKSVRVVKRTSRATEVEVVVAEGLNREVRRMFARVGYGVKRLKRVRIGSLGLRGVPQGAIRPLTRAEYQELVDLAQGRPQAPRRRGGRLPKLPKAKRLRRPPAAGGGRKG